jgi:hypothetical protein
MKYNFGMFNLNRRLFWRENEGLQNLGGFASIRQRINRKSSDLRSAQSKIRQDRSGKDERKN